MSVALAGEGSRCIAECVSGALGRPVALTTGCSGWTSGLSPASPQIHGPVRVEQEAQRKELELFFFIPM